MGSREKSRKSAISSKKFKASRKTVPTSAEHILNSDVEAETDSDDSGTLIATQSKASKRLPQANGTKRKSTEASESSTKKKTKLNIVEEGRSSDSSISTARSDNAVPHLNGSPGKSGKFNGKAIPKQLEFDTSNSEPSGSGKLSSHKIIETPEKTPASNDTMSGIRMSLSESSSAPSHSGAEDDDDEDRQPDKLALSQIAEGDIAAIKSPRAAAKDFQSYRPPEGFSSATIPPLDRNDIQSILSKENLSGKQLWHITVPGSIPISDIKKFARKDMLSGQTILSHSGAIYGFNSNMEHASSSKILIPGQAGNSYQLIGRDIDLHLNLRQSLELRDVDNDSTQSRRNLNTISGARKTKLEQPSGLRMRYRPFGDVDYHATEKNAARQAQQRMDNAKIPLPKDISSTTPKKSKKANKSSSQLETQEWTDPQAYSAPIVVGGDSQHTVELPSAALNSSQLEVNDTESLEAKARKKAEKAAKKNERKRRKEAQAVSV